MIMNKFSTSKFLQWVTQFDLVVGYTSFDSVHFMISRHREVGLKNEKQLISMSGYRRDEKLGGRV